MLPHYLVNVFGTRNCHVNEMSEKNLARKLKLSCNIQPFKNSRWKSTVWRCKRYLINWQKYFRSVDTAQPTERSIICICVINVTGNCFCTRSSTCDALCLLFCQMFTDLESFFHWQTQQWLPVLKISPHLTGVATLPFYLSVITTLVWECRLFSDIDVLPRIV